MKNQLFLALSILFLALTSCKSDRQSAIDKAVDGDIIVSGKDTFDITVDTHIVIGSERIPPSSVLEESSPVWLYRTNLDSTFKSRKNIPIGSKQVYKIAKKRK